MGRGGLKPEFPTVAGIQGNIVSSIKMFKPRRREFFVIIAGSISGNSDTSGNTPPSRYALNWSALVDPPAVKANEIRCPLFVQL